MVIIALFLLMNSLRIIFYFSSCFVLDFCSRKADLKQPWRVKEGITEKLTSGLKPGK